MDKETVKTDYMLTINLEKTLLKTNRKIYSPSELLVIKEYDRLAELKENKTLERIGMKSNIILGEHLKNEGFLSKKQTEQFNQERIFHISQIKNICNKYHLRFLPAKLFNGSIDASLPDKINTFEVAYNVQANHDNSFIIAPASSFKLEAKPKDPLFFYKINDSYYYLVHKWGNDLSLFRRFLPALSSQKISNGIVITVLLLLSFLFVWRFKAPSVGILQVILFSLCIACVGWLFLNFFYACIKGFDEAYMFEDNGFVKKNYWDSKIK